MSDLLARLIADGASADIVAEVAMLLAEKRLLDDRRAGERQRKQAQRNREKDNECHVTSRDVTGQDGTSQAPPLSRPPNEINSNPPTHTPPDNKPARGKSVGKPDGVKDQTWRDFVAMRNRKRAPITETAMAGILREADKAGWPIERALAESVTRGWQSFKAEWVEASPQARPRSAVPV